MFFKVSKTDATFSSAGNGAWKPIFNMSLNTLSASPKKWSNTLKKIVPTLPTNCLSVFHHFVKLALK